MGISKLVYNNEVKFDLTADTVTAASLLKDVTAHSCSGDQITGTCTFDADSSDATANAAELLLGRTAYARGAKLSGIMPNNGGASGTISSASEEYTIEQGYHDGSGKVSISAAERAKIISGNIKSGISILGVTGTYGGDSVTAQSKSVVPGFTEQTVLPDESFDYLSQVTVSPIPYTETPNSAGGITIAIG